MSVDRVWRWTCDGCNAVAERDGYGLPRGWIFVKAVVITHRCEECKADIPERQKGIPLVVAER